MKELKSTKDPRVLGKGDMFDKFPYYGGKGKKGKKKKKKKLNFLYK